MNKAELVNAIANETGLSKKDTEATINSFVNVVTNALENKDKVQLIGFGTFETRERAEKIGRNPQTGAELKIPAATTPAFKAGKALKEKVNK
ncbi:bacterial nucleoid protein Hbs [Clostridium sp. CAG:798]|nr:bacterial nucleoid protein Hbs [Clostridium sp. CAG:798]